MINILEFRKVFDFIEEEMPSTNLNDIELKSVYELYSQWQGQTLPIHDVSTSLLDNNFSKVSESEMDSICNRNGHAKQSALKK